ncbi:MAG: transaldolase [Planctomycetes bacterium]|nr:transaldolase [Planctomycetota bacterium]
MSNPLESLMACGTKLWLDSIDPDLVAANRAWGATGATSNPIIIADLIKTGRFDADIARLAELGRSDEAIAWALTDELVSRAQAVFLPVWEQTDGNDGYVSFELDPLIEDTERNLPHADRVARYIESGARWASGHSNRMIKVPATPAGLDSLEDLCAAGVPLNVTLIFSERQYEAARDAVWRGAARRGTPPRFKSVYSIFVSRVDVYTRNAVPDLSNRAQGQVGIVNAKRIWRRNRAFWNDHRVPLEQEIVFASTGTKYAEDAAWKYVEAFAGSDIQTNPPATNEAVLASGLSFSPRVDDLPPDEVLSEIDRLVDPAEMEATLMAEGLRKFADPQKGLLRLIADHRARLAGATA